MNIHELDYELDCREFWKQVWIAVAGSSNTIEKDIPNFWADAALKSYKSRFKPLYPPNGSKTNA